MGKASPNIQHRGEPIVSNVLLSSMSQSGLLEMISGILRDTTEVKPAVTMASVIGKTPAYIYEAIQGGTFLSLEDMWKIQRTLLPYPLVDLWIDAKRNGGKS